MSGERDHKFESMRHIMFDFGDSGPLAKRAQLHPEVRSIESVYEQLNKGNPEYKEWAQSAGISIRDGKLVGDFMQLSAIGRYYPKLERALQYLKSKPGKSFLYFNTVNTYGVAFIGDVLKANGLIEIGSPPQRDTLCYQCKVPYSMHQSDHAFIPYTFFKISSAERIDYQAALKQFNNPLNNSVHLVVGSKKTIQGINLIGVNNVYVMSLPYNISNLIQVMGRAIRNKSHQFLPEAQRFVDIHILVTAMPEAAHAESLSDQLLTREHQDYIDKLKEHR